MKSKVLIVLLLVLAVVFAGCKKGSTDPLVGSWKVTEAKGTAADSNLGIIYVFGSDGEVEFKGSFSNKAKYKKTGNLLEMSFANNVVMKAEIEFVGDKKIIYKIQNSDQVFTLEKQ